MKAVVLEGEVTKQGFVALWESGGARRSTGCSTIITKPDGSIPTAVYIRKRGPLACNKHALIPVHSGYYVIHTEHYQGDFSVFVCKVLLAGAKKVEIITDLTNVFNDGEWNVKPEAKLLDAIEAARLKAECYHCRDIFYARTKEKTEA